MASVWRLRRGLACARGCSIRAAIRAGSFRAACRQLAGSLEARTRSVRRRRAQSNAQSRHTHSAGPERRARPNLARKCAPGTRAAGCGPPGGATRRIMSAQDGAPYQSSQVAPRNLRPPEAREEPAPSGRKWGQEGGFGASFVTVAPAAKDINQGDKGDARDAIRVIE